MRQRSFLLFVAFLSLLFFLSGNAYLAVTDPVESNYALTAKEMVLSGDWISPHIYGIPWYDKPIFIYWLISLSYTLFGITDFAARLPSALFGAAAVVLSAWYVRRAAASTAAAALMAAMTATSVAVWIISKSVITDQMLFFFTTGTMLFAAISLTETKPFYIRLAYVFSALAVLTKGPVGIVLPGLFLLLFAALSRRKDYLKLIFAPFGILCFLVIAAPWYGAMYALHGTAFVDGFLGLNNIVRATVSEHPEANVWYYYLLLVPVSLLPWTGPCLCGLWQHRRDDGSHRLFLIWAVGTVVFYSLMATKYPTYAYIANWPLLYFGVAAIKSIYASESRKYWFIVTAPVLFLWLLFFATACVSDPKNIALPPLTGIIVFLPAAAAILAVCQYFRAFPAIPFVAACGTAVLYLLLTYQVLVPFYDYRSTTALLPAAAQLRGDSCFFGEYSTSFVYYTGRSAVLIAPESAATAAPPKRDAVWQRKHLYREEGETAIIDKIKQGKAVTVIVKDNRREEFAHSALKNYFRAAGTYGNFHLYVTP